MKFDAAAGQVSCCGFDKSKQLHIQSDLTVEVGRGQNTAYTGSNKTKYYIIIYVF